MNETGITACESVSDLFTFMSSMTSRLWTADKLIAVRFHPPSFRNSTDVLAATCLQTYHQTCRDKVEMREAGRSAGRPGFVER